MVLTSQTRVYISVRQAQSSIIEHKSLGEIMRFFYIELNIV